MNNETRDERLRRLLREGDSTATDPGLTLDEVREMRRTVLTAVPERRRKFLPVFALAGAATVVLILLAVLVFRTAPEKAPAPPRIAVAPPPAITIQPPRPQEEPRPREAKKETPVRHKRRTPKIRPVPMEPEPAAVLAATEPRQIQFSTPGGTRIIWLLSPGDASLQGE